MPTKFRRNIRLKKYDYSADGYYFVTIVTRDRLPLLKPYKDAIEITIKKLPDFIDGLSIDYFKIIDNHIHIIFIFQDCPKPLGRVVSAMKYSITKIVAVGLPSHDVWQWNYYEHIIRNEKSLQKIREYIDNNPVVEIMNWKNLDNM